MRNKSQSSKLSQEILERLDDAKNIVRISHERVRYMQAVARLLIFDNYVSGKMALLFDVHAFNVTNHVGRELQIEGTAAPGPRYAMLINYNDASNASFGENWNQKPVFVSNIKAVNGPYGVLHSTMRLYRVHHELKEVRGCAIYASLRHRTFKFFDGFMHGELGAAIDKRRHQSLDGLQPGVIESAIQVVNCIPNHQCEISEGSFVTEGMFKDFASSFRIDLDSRSVGFMQKGDTFLNISDVMIGPVNLESRISE